jgi:hypothetical protein
MAQFLRPDSNVTQTSFTGGFAAIDEATASDADFAYGDNNTAAVLEVGLSNPAATPDPAGTSTVRYRIARTNAGTVNGAGNAVNVTPEVYQGPTLIQAGTAQTATGTWAQYTFTFTHGSITDWTNVRLRFTTTASGGSPANRRGGAVSWAEVEAPDAAPTAYTLPVDAGTFTLTGNAATLQQTHKAIVDAGSYTLTGNAVTLTVGGGLNNYSLAADTTNFTGSYSSTGLVLNRRLFADTGGFVLGFSDTGLRQSNRLSADPGSYSFTSNAVNLTFTPVFTGYSLTAAPAAFIFTAPTVPLAKGWRLEAAIGSYLLTGVDVGFRQTYVLTAASRAFTFNFISANLSYSGAQQTVKRFYYQAITDDPKNLDVGGVAPGAGLVYYINKHFRVL